jgi:hypothetical protein
MDLSFGANWTEEFTLNAWEDNIEMDLKETGSRMQVFKFSERCAGGVRPTGIYEYSLVIEQFVLLVVSKRRKQITHWHGLVIPKNETLTAEDVDWIYVAQNTGN